MTDQQACDDILQIERRGRAALLRLCGDFFQNIKDLGRRDRVLNAFDSLSMDKDISVIILSTAYCGVGVEEYVRFFREQLEGMEKQAAHRFCNAVNQVMLEMVRSGKLVVHTCCGDMLTFFLGVSMAADYSIVAEDSVFHNSYLDIGTLPKGGLPYFVSRKLGNRAVYELLLAERELSAQQALKLGLVDAVVPKEQMEEAAFAYAARFENVSPRTITGTKRLTNWCIRDLEEYLSYENKQMMKTLDQFG
ncbi:enoyl-CoA hydratase/isomerase family protein [Desulfovibrio mangrovi]|uniref:enoyl-CoA hydratase/isomerase family protein n=1 Tax=Desulfovibrio mangrovi TaxID=2976983 RepID=UPI002245F712|nr:enoyl-CoA hydratase/isomerase family protein [Desulfovibrio mangrovi]UZP66993.1 enoyl-CoA hydratase/isomerase family protein [Desulfovibrio mangrovi]